jgi:Cu2+-exporting ATPase
MSAAAETGLFLDGTRCAGCVHRIERALQETPGVVEASVHYTTQRALVRFDPARTSPAALAGRVAELGYGATPFDPAALDRSAAATRGAREALVRVLVAAFLAGNVMLVSIALYIGSYQGIDAATRRGLRWLAVALSVPAVAWCALPFWRGAWAGLRRRSITVDVPVALGVGVAFAVNVAGTLAETEHLFVDSAAMIVFLILLGRTLERSARARATSAVDRLVALAPRTALRRTPAGIEEVPARELRAGDRVVVPPGQGVPADGRIVAGETELDESLLTGESRPVARHPGEAVAGGSRNCLAEIEVEVTAALDSGTLARMAALLERAQADRPRVQRLADRVAAVFAPAVLGLASLTALGWALAGAPPLEVALAASAVLIVACPCALGLATPAAVTAALGRAARLGILVKRGEALERWARVDTVLLDKTGTVTEGRFAVDEAVPVRDVSPEALVAVAARVEGASTHPLAAAVRAEASRRGIAPEDDGTLVRRAVAGRGVVAGELRAGSRRFLEEAGVSVEPALAEAGAKLAERGLSTVWVAAGSRALGVLGLSDPPRPDAGEAVARLRARGVRVELVSGDAAGPVRLAGERCGLAAGAAASEVDPEAKVERVRAARAAGRRVLVAGDGINDAAALAAADVGVAMGSGADVALHAADVVIRAPRLGALADGADLARATLARIRENLGIALLYNALAVPLAVAGVLQPLHAAIAMSLSSLVVTGNAVRLLRWRPRP